MGSPIKIKWNPDRYFELWIGNCHSDFDPILLGILVAFLILGMLLIGLGIYYAISGGSLWA